MATPSVSVVVPVYNEARRPEALIASLRAQDYAGTTELVFVDGDSADESMMILQHAAAESTARLLIVTVHHRSFITASRTCAVGVHARTKRRTSPGKDCLLRSGRARAVAPDLGDRSCSHGTEWRATAAWHEP